MDIHAGFIAASVLLAIWAILVFRSGLFAFRSAAKLNFYRIKRARESRGRWLILASIALVACAVLLPIYGQPVVYHYFPPSPTVAPTFTPSVVPTITLSPTITLTPTITDTPLYSETPTATITPFLPMAIEAQFASLVTPNPDAVISPLTFSTELKNSLPASPGVLFRNPIRHMYATFSYDKMLTGVQWTAVWLYNGTMVYFETIPWNGGTGGYGYSDWGPSPDKWQPGVYTVQIFVGHDFKRAGSFTVEGEAPTAAPAPIPSATLSLAPTLTTTP